MAVQAAANQSDLVRRFGSLQILEIDPGQKRFFVSLILRGESEPIQCRGRYAVEGNCLYVEDLQISRPWMQEILAVLASREKRFKLEFPDSMGWLMRYLL